MRSHVYYDYIDGRNEPVWYVVYFERGEVDWTKDTVYFKPNNPFSVQNIECFEYIETGFSILMSDLIKNSEAPFSFGIYLPRVKKRLDEAGVDPHELTSFVIRVVDIAALMEMAVIQKNASMKI